MPRSPVSGEGRHRYARLRPTPLLKSLGWLGVGLLAAAVNTGNNLIYLVFSLLVASVPVSLVVCAVNFRRLRFNLRFPAAPRVGAPFAIDVEIANHRRKFAARSVEIAILTDQGEFGPAFVERIDAGSTTRLTLLARGARRGPLRITGLAVRSMFPLALIRHWKNFERSDEILILPGASGSAHPWQRSTHNPGGAALSPHVQGTEYVGLRRGAAEDDARKVDWKVTARRGVLMVRESAGEGRHEVELSVETRRSGEPVQARIAFEEQITRIAGGAARTLGAGGVVRLFVDGKARSYSGRIGLLHLLRSLARLSPTGEDGDPLPPLPEPEEQKQTGPDPPAPRATAPGRVFRASALAALLIGTVTLFACEGIGPLSLGALLASLLVTTVSDRAIAGKGSFAERLWKLAGIGALILFLADIIWLRQNLLSASSSLLVFITLFALYNARVIADDLRILLLSFLQMVLAAALTTEVALALPLLGWLLATTHCLIAATVVVGASAAKRRPVLLDARAGRLRYAAPMLGATAAVVAIGIVVFVLVPHLGTGTFRPGALRGPRVSGFSDTTSLGDIGRIKLDNSRVMEVELAGARVSDADLKWRGRALNRFDGRSWTRSVQRFKRLTANVDGRFFPAGDRGGTRAGGVVSQNIRLEPLDSTVVFAAARPRQLTSKDFRVLGEDGSGNLELRRNPGRRLSYTVLSEPPPRDPDILRGAGGEDPPAVLDRNLGLPPLDERIGVLAREITAGAPTRYDAALAIESWLSDRLEYSLDVRDAGAEDPLAHFLFEGMAGHCEYFATAMVVLARSVEIPARFVAGYLRGDKSRFGRRYLVRQSDAHSWVEVHFAGVGWVSFDPTPPDGRGVGEAQGLTDLAAYVYSSVARIWDDYLIGIDLDDQARGLLAVLSAVAVGTERLRAAIAGIASWSLLSRLVGAVALFTLWLAWRKGWLRWERRAKKTSVRRAPRAVPTFYVQVLELLARKGLSRQPGETPAEFAERSGTVLPPRSVDRMRELTRLYYRVRFDRSTNERQVRRIARALVGDVKESLP